MRVALRDCTKDGPPDALKSFTWTKARDDENTNFTRRLGYIVVQPSAGSPPVFPIMQFETNIHGSSCFIDYAQSFKEAEEKAYSHALQSALVLATEEGAGLFDETKRTHQLSY